MRASEIRVGMTVLVTREVAHPSNPNPYDGKKVNILRVAIRTYLEATGA